MTSGHTDRVGGSRDSVANMEMEWRQEARNPRTVLLISTHGADVVIYIFKRRQRQLSELCGSLRVLASALE